MARARELGVTVFDTAEIYGFGRSERILGAALRASGGVDDVVVASKVFPVLPDRRDRAAARRGQRPAARRAADRPLPGAPAQPGRRDAHDHARHAGAARRRGRRRRGRVELPLAALAEGRSVACGASIGTEVELGGRVLSNQVQFSLVSRGPLAEMLPWAQRTGHLVMAYSPLAQGLLSGRYNAAVPAVGRRAGGERPVPAREPRRRRAAARPAPRGGRGARRHPGPDRAGLAGAPAERRRDPGRVQRGAGREQRRRRGHHPRPTTSTRPSPRPRRRSSR